MWSESPIRRPYPRVRQVGVPAPVAACVTYPPPYPPSGAGNYCPGPPAAPGQFGGPCTVRVTVSESPSVVVIQLYAQDSHDEAQGATLAGGEWVADFPDWPGGVLYADVGAYADVLYGTRLTLTNVRICPLGGT
jgi:hypothetical protein